MTDTINPQLLSGSCTYWSLPESERQAINATVPDQDTWVLDVRRNPDGTWEFDLPQFKTFSELFVGNTEKVLDMHYNKMSETPADQYSTMRLTVSSEPLPKHTTTCKFISPCPDFSGASIYLDDVFLEEVWLCPYVQTLFKYVPKKLHILMEVTS